MSVYEKFLDNYKSKLCESKSKKVSLKKLKRVNESDAYEKELRYETVADEHIGLNKLEYDDGSVQYLVYGTTFKDEYIDNKEEAEEFFGDMLDELLEKYGYIDIDKQGIIAFELKDGTEIAVNKLIRADGKFDFEAIIGYDNYAPIFSTEEEALEYVDDFLKEQGYTDAEIEELYEKGYLDESCGKRKPKKPFLRKSLKESAKERFLKKVFSKSKLSESRTLKRTRKVKVPMNEATVNYLLRFTADGIKAGCLIGTKKDIDSIKRIYKNKSFKEIETYRLKSSDEETMYYQMEKLANSVKGKKGVDIRKTNDGKIGAIYFTDEYKGNEYKKILD